jgi:hypothetical protein
MLYTAESGQFYSRFSPTTISLTLRFRWKREVWLHTFAENAQYDPKTHNCKDNAKFTLRFCNATMLRAFSENGEWLKILNIWANLNKIFKTDGCTVFCFYLWLKDAKKSLKTD